jgi:tetratricopeptide (TPR) repeat protein
MWDWINEEGFKSIWRNYNYTLGLSVISILYLFGFLGFSKSFGEDIGTSIGFIALIIAVYSIQSTTKQLDTAQKQLSDIQIDYWNTRGIDQYKQKRYREADQSYERTINLNQQDTKVWINIAVSLYEQNKLDEALNAINKAIDMDQGRADSWNNKAIIIRSKATNIIEKTIDLNTELKMVQTSKYVVPLAQPIVFMELNNEALGAWDNKGEALLAQALLALERAIELKTIERTHRPPQIAGDWLDKGSLAGAWSNIGSILDLQHKYNQAIMAYDKAIELDPKYVAAWFNKGFALVSGGRQDEAIAAFNKAIELDPKNVNSWLGKGSALSKIASHSNKEYAKDFYDEAIHAFDKAIEFDPLYHKGWHEKGRVLFEVGHYNEAIEVLDKVIDIKPYDLSAWHNKCLSLYRLGKHNEAIKALNTTIWLYTQYALSWFDEYNKLNKLGKYDEAIEAYDQGLELYTKNTLNWVVMGDAICNLALWHPRDFEYALEAYNRSIRLDPFNMLAWFGRCITLNALGFTDASREAYVHADRLTLLLQPCQYVEDSEKPFYWT